MKASIALHQSLGFKQVSRFEKVGLKFGRQLDVVDFLSLSFSPEINRPQFISIH